MNPPGRFLFLFAVILLVPALDALGQGGVSNTTITASSSSSIGATNQEFVWIEEAIGPADIFIGDFGSCPITRPLDPNTYGCHALGGSGTVSDPFWGICSSNCSNTGTPFNVPSGYNNLNYHTHTVIAQGTTVTQKPVPLGPWVPLGSAFGIGLLALARSYRQSRRRR